LVVSSALEHDSFIAVGILAKEPFVAYHSFTDIIFGSPKLYHYQEYNQLSSVLLLKQ